MAADSDSAKTQLSALFRLEFYRSQKKWKLSKDVRKKPPPSTKTANKPNRTFIKGEEIPEPEFEGDPVSPDNEVILNEKPDATQSGVPPDQPYSGDGAEAEGLWQEPELPAAQPHHNLNWQNQCGAEAAGIPEMLADDQCGTEAARLTEELAYDQCDTAGFLQELANDQYSPKPAVLSEELALDPEAAQLSEELAYNQYIKEAAGFPEDFAYDQCGSGAAKFPEDLAFDPEAALLPEELVHNQCIKEAAGLCENSAYDQCVFDFQNAVDTVDCTPGGYLTPAQMQGIAEQWLLHDYPAYQEDEHKGLSEFEALFKPPTSAALSCSIKLPSQFMSELVDETADFMRGAHEALHSSEIDLSTTQVKQIERAVQRHQHALSLLLEELAYRDRLKVQSLRSLPYPLLPFEDWMMSGTGRGRGRLQQARARMQNYDTIFK